MTNQEQQNWLAQNQCNLFIAKEFYHHHAFEIINTHHSLRESFKAVLNSPIHIAPRIKKTKDKSSKGISAENLNIEIRKLLKTINDIEIKFEVNEEKGIFYFSSEKSAIGGFDFAILNHEKNLSALRNLCFGELHYHTGEVKWQKFLEKNQDLIDIANNLKNIDKLGTNIEYIDANNPALYTPLIVGEIQFGNWALAYRDFFKVLKANVQNSVDCLMYVVPTGNLEIMLSDGIVTFDKTKRILEDFAKVISVPIWVIGIDVE